MGNLGDFENQRPADVMGRDYAGVSGLNGAFVEVDTAPGYGALQLVVSVPVAGGSRQSMRVMLGEDAAKAFAAVISNKLQDKAPGNVEATPAVASVLDAVLQELNEAAGKFPLWPDDPLHALAVVNEQVGGLNKLTLHRLYEPTKADREAIRQEGVRVAAMAVRFLANMGNYKWQASSQHTDRWVK